jgi:hypothetical protein
LEIKIKATDPQMIDEAIFRMKSIGLPQSYIDAFAMNNDIRTYLSPGGGSNVCDEWENGILGFYETPYHGYPWGIIKEESGLLAFDPWVAYHILYVSPEPENWDKERAELAALEPTVFSISYPLNLYPDEMTIVFEKKKIRLSEDGSIVLV